jgi:hypothetical protein
MTARLIQFCPSLQLLQIFFHCIKKVLDTELNGYHCFNCTEKTFLRSVDRKQPSNFHFDLSSKFPQGGGGVHDFSGEVQKFSGEVQNDLRGGAHLPSKSGHVRANPALNSRPLRLN